MKYYLYIIVNKYRINIFDFLNIVFIKKNYYLNKNEILFVNINYYLSVFIFRDLILNMKYKDANESGNFWYSILSNFNRIDLINYNRV